MKAYLSLIQFAHTVFALPFALLAFFIGLKTLDIQINWLVFLYILLCMVFARSAAMAFNRYVDRHIDAKNKRTVIREIPSGAIKPLSALTMVASRCAITIEVRPFVIVSVARCINSSEYVSIDEVASSNIKILGLLT